MNKNNLVALVFVSLIFSLSIFAQNAKSDGDIKTVVKKLFEFCEKNDFKSAATIVAYDGPDKERFLNSFSDYKIASEKRRVDKICKRINALRKMSDEYSIELAEGKPFKDKPVEVARVIFSSGKQQLKLEFQFTRINGKPGLIDIN